jgi:hypothetical protein
VCFGTAPSGVGGGNSSELERRNMYCLLYYLVKADHEITNFREVLDDYRVTDVYWGVDS